MNDATYEKKLIVAWLREQANDVAAEGNENALADQIEQDAHIKLELKALKKAINAHVDRLNGEPK